MAWGSGGSGGSSGGAAYLVSTGNSTTSTLGSGGVFTGAAEDVSRYSMITVFIHSDVASATKGLSLELSVDGVNWDRTKTITAQANASQTAFGGVHTLAVVSQFFRVVYTNGAGAQSEFRLQTIYHDSKSKFLTSILDQTINDQADVELTRAALMGQDPAGNFRNVPVDVEGHLRTHISDPLSAFGDLRTSRLTPITQIYFAYNINTDLVTTTTNGSGTVTQSNAKAVISSGAASSSDARMETKAFVKYRAGQGSLLRFTGIFTTGVTGNTQYLGAFDDDNGVGFGYSGTTFGLFLRSNTSTTFVAQSSWNVDVMDGTDGDDNPSNVTLDPTKGNVYEISYQWLGFGEIKYYIENPNTGEFTVVHRVQYANNYTDPSMFNPTFPLAVESNNTTNTTNVTVSTSSMAGFTEGEDKVTGPANSISNQKAVTTEENILTIRNKTTFASKNNKVTIRLKIGSAATDGTKNATIRFIKNTTLGGIPSYSDISTNTSTVEYDTAGTTITGGQVVDSITLAKEDSAKENLEELDVFLGPGETLTVSGESSSSNTIDATLSWREDF